jgi:hypothetical protein
VLQRPAPAPIPPVGRAGVGDRREEARRAVQPVGKRQPADEPVALAQRVVDAADHPVGPAALGRQDEVVVPEERAHADVRRRIICQRALSFAVQQE